MLLPIRPRFYIFERFLFSFALANAVYAIQCFCLCLRFTVLAAHVRAAVRSLSARAAVRVLAWARAGGARAGRARAGRARVRRRGRVRGGRVLAAVPQPARLLRVQVLPGVRTQVSDQHYTHCR